MTVIRMKEEHLPKIAALEQICFSEPWSENALRDTLEDPKAVFFAAVEEDEVLGYAGMHDIVGEGYVDNIAVFPEHRGKGIGEVLTQALIDYTVSAGLEFLTLEVRAGNVPAVSLYKKLGMQEEGRRKNFYRHPTEDALIMTLHRDNK